MIIMKSEKRFYRKDLREALGLDENQITPIVARTAIFREGSSKRGYATQYDYNQVFFICVGCELLSLGLSLRYADMALTKLSMLIDVKLYKAIRERQLVLIFAPSGLKYVKRLADKGEGGKIIVDLNSLKLVCDSIIGNVEGKSVVNNQPVCFDLGKEFHKNRMSPLTMIIEEKNDRTLHDGLYDSVLSSFLTVKLYLIVEKLDQLFK